ncbi:hypothetical protein Taro_022266 [Colocasia esculenta]|uniref:Uncharacterized protein n=1 Tax=Colocasia esculenta TaxID=4460 RepID=A0A843V7W6_COLES|nr:hypothetical protein [Colocasia esculenta]
MASMKVEKPEASQAAVGTAQPKKEPSKAGDGPARSRASRPAAPKKAEQKPREAKKKLTRGAKPAAKN